MTSYAATELAERLRALPWPGPVVEKRMFGGIAFMLRGNMVVCPTKEGLLIVRVGREGMADALAQPGAGEMDMAGRTMSGFVVVDGDAIEDEDALRSWRDRALAFVATLPSK